MQPYARLLRLQGLVFSFSALLVAGLAAHFSLAVTMPLLVALSVTILLLGVPHGALDPIFARRTFKLNGVGAWVGWRDCRMAAVSWSYLHLSSQVS